MPVAEAYLTYCDCQPLPLFHSPSFLGSLEDRDPEVVFAVLALASRFSDQPSFREDHEDQVEHLLESARAIVSKRVLRGTVEMSTIQSLCLMSLVDFTSMSPPDSQCRPDSLQMETLVVPVSTVVLL